MPDFDYQAAAAQAIAELDVNGDGSISREECKGSVGLTAAFSQFDKDNSASISRDEFTNRLKFYLDAGIALYGWSCEVRQAGRPLSGATVTLIPEKFLGAVAQPARGVTDAQGVAMPVVDDKMQQGVGFGLYRIEISKKDAAGRELVPASLNIQTTLGQELAPDNRSAETRRMIDIGS